MSNWNKANNYTDLLECTSNSTGGGISKVISDVGAVWTPGSFYADEIVDNPFVYGDSVVGMLVRFHAFNTVSAIGAGSLSYAEGSTITSSDWADDYGHTGVKLTVSVHDYLMGEYKDNLGRLYTRANALGQCIFQVSTYTVGSYGYTVDDPYYPDITMFIKLVEFTDNGITTLNINFTKATGTYTVTSGLQYDYNRLYSGTKTVRFIIEGYNITSGSSSARFTFTANWEDPSFFDATKISLSWGSSKVTSGSSIRLTVPNPMRLNYTISGNDGAGHSLLGITGSHIAESAEDAAYVYETLTPSSRNDWLATVTGIAGWVESYTGYAVVSYSTNNLTNSWNINTYIIGSSTAVATSPMLTIKTNNNFVGDLSLGTYTHTTASTNAIIIPLYVDGKTQLRFNLNGVKVPYWYNYPNYDFFIDLIASDGTNTQIETVFSTTWDGLVANYSTVADEELVLAHIPTGITKTINMHLPYATTASDFTIKLVFRYQYNQESYQRGEYTWITDVCYPYKNPIVNAFNGHRYSVGTTSSYKIDETNGTIAGIYASFDLTPINNNNIFEVHSISVKETAETASTYWTSDINSGIRLYKPETAYQLDIDKSYIVTLTLTDSLNTTVIVSLTIPAGSCFLDFHAGGGGMAIGKASEGLGLEINFDTHFLQDVDFGTSASPVNLDFTNTNISGLSLGDITIANNQKLTIASGGTLDIQGDVEGIRQSFVIPYTLSSTQKFLAKFTQYDDNTYYFELDGKAPFTKSSASGMTGTYTYTFTLGTAVIFPSDPYNYFLNVTLASLQTGGINNNALLPSYASATGNGTNAMTLTVGLTSKITMSGDPTFPTNMVFNFHVSGLIPVAA